MFGMVIWCPECGYTKAIEEWTQYVAAVASGEFPHRRPTGGDCLTKLKKRITYEGVEDVGRIHSLPRD